MSSVILRRCASNKLFLRSANALSVANRKESNVNIVRSAVPDIPIPNLTISQYLFEKFARWPNKTAVECGATGKNFTYEEFITKSRNFGKALRKKLNLQQGDVIAVLLPNVPEYTICLLGSMEAGLVITTINPMYTTDEIHRQLVDSNAKALITLTALYPPAQAAIKQLDRSIPIITVKMTEAEATPEGTIKFTEFSDNKVDLDDLSSLDPNSVVLLPYSSGTTGLPKGVELTHINVLSNLGQSDVPEFMINQPTTETHQDVVPAVLPWFHIYGISGVLFQCLRYNCKLVSLPKFTPELYVKTLANYKPHLLFIVPPIVIFMSSHPSVKKEYLDSIRMILSGAAPLGSLDEEKLRRKIARPVDILQGYGLTETSPLVFVSSASKKKKLGLVGTVGEVVPNTMVKIVPVDNPEGEALGPNQPGELLVKGPQVMKRYHNKPKETEEVFVDGWLRTGDMLYYDEHKSFYVTDRLKELIKVKGFQVAPAELEAIIRSHPMVDDAAVIGIPHETDGEAPRAYVVPKANTKLDIQELQDFVAERVTSYKQLSGGVALVESIPKNASGKIMRRDLKLRYAN